MLNLLGFEIALGKRKMHPYLDLDKFYSIEEGKPPEKGEKNEEDAHAHSPDFSELSKIPEDSGLLIRSSKATWKPVSPPVLNVCYLEQSHPYIHSRLVILMDILREVCLADRFNMKLYRMLDERQKSLMNKILASMFETKFLDVIDTFQKEFFFTQGYLVKNRTNSDNLVLHLRLQCLIRIKSAARMSAGDRGSIYWENQIAKEYFAEFLSDPCIGPLKCSASIMYEQVLREIEAIKFTAASALNIGRTDQWLTSMLFLLQGLLLVPFDQVFELYASRLDLRLSFLLHDTDNDLSRFYTKLKSKLNSKAVRPPVTLCQLKLWDMTTVQMLKFKIDSLQLCLSGK